jgi:hypothetical protein
MMDYELRVGSSARSERARIAYLIRNMTLEQRERALLRIQAETLMREPGKELERIVERLKR